MDLEVKKMEQGPVLAAKGDVGLGSAGGAGPVTVQTGGNGQVGGPVNSSGQPAAGYQCSF